ncbi:MAG: cytochrome c3 family protein [Bacillota bacterium]
MKKLGLISLLVIGILLVVGVGSAAAYTLSGNIHGGYTSTTDACGKCHSTHAAAGANLIQTLGGSGSNDMYKTCIYCHDGSGSKYNEVDGAVTVTGYTYASSAGGFTNMVTAEGAVPTTVAVDSKHNVNEITGTTQWVPGYDTAVGSKMELTCASCHDPHNKYSVARALRVSGLNGVDLTLTKPTLDIPSGVQANEAITYQSNWNEFCAACHADFKQTAAGSGDADSGTYSTKKRHRVGMDPAAYTGTASTSWTVAALSQPSGVMPLQSTDGTALNEKVMCLTCHYAHGTPKTNTVTFNRTNSTYGATTASSTLLRLDNRGVCEACHNK